MNVGEETVTSMLVLHSGGLSDAAREALKASATALEHRVAPEFVDVEGCEPQELVLRIHSCDPWSVVAGDNASIDLLREAFSLTEDQFAPDAPAIVHGYTFVAVPDFEACLDDQAAKRIAWSRLKAARYPGRPC